MRPERRVRVSLTNQEGFQVSETSRMSADERVVATMVGLARAVPSHRIIVAGDGGADVLLTLLRRGYLRAATVATSRFPCGQYEVALAHWPDQTATLEAMLARLVLYLKPRGVMVMWIGPQEPMPHRKLGPVLRRLGFRIEAGTRCERGVAIAARRLEQTAVANVA